MTSAVGFPTLRLIRVRIGTFVLDNLEVGEVKEVEKLLWLLSQKIKKISFNFDVWTTLIQLYIL